MFHKGSISFLVGTWVVCFYNKGIWQVSKKYNHIFQGYFLSPSREILFENPLYHAQLLCKKKK